MLKVKTQIFLFLFFSMSACTTTTKIDFKNFKHPIIVSKKRYPHDKEEKTRLSEKTFLIKKSEKKDRYINQWEDNTETAPKIAIRGIKKPYIRVNTIHFEAHSYSNFMGGSSNRSSHITLDSKLGSMAKESGEE